MAKAHGTTSPTNPYLKEFQNEERLLFEYRQVVIDAANIYAQHSTSQTSCDHVLDITHSPTSESIVVVIIFIIIFIIIVIIVIIIIIIVIIIIIIIIIIVVVVIVIIIVIILIIIIITIIIKWKKALY